MPTSPRRKKPPPLIGVVAAVVVVAVALVGVQWLLSRSSAQPSGSSPTASSSPARTTQTVGGTSGLPTIRLATLPKEAQRTVQLITTGGPFPYAKDGITFGNREGVLPRRASGYYREYTVITPGSSDRGARRIIAGRGGEEFYTDDHYVSFREIVS